ncbi:hypothetical protein B0H67DRAFT_590943 [Lasiosphaeris hirsuta]|uniref:Uncharacterized protein n=1 Tax=Lasiosphaeris hirsuta TaxID=260670 RepID=A0AA40DMJ7_9PEZI|nr:hypothetical protein B0H67DRAFT_590943 [Lasiosphaeris hirsuta]
MAAPPSPQATISISSGCLCFGALNNIWNGASVPVQPFPALAQPHTSGTVKTQSIEFNTAARNGTWNVFQLMDLRTKEVAAWFLAHSDVNPQAEMDRILGVAGSPYELDSGSQCNDENTARNGVFVINRYDWGYYSDQRSRDEVVVAEELEREAGTLGTIFESVGLVDLAMARSMVLQWKAQRSGERLWSEGGAWLHIPGGEYMFGRFGFDDDRLAARSFLFFTTNTCFTRTTFKGLDQPLRKEETPKERFERKVREGCDFSGLEELHKFARPPEAPGFVSLSPPPPPLADCFGPYDQRDHILRNEDIINAIHAHQNSEEPPTTKDTIEPWEELVYDVLNEMLLSYLQRTVVPRMRNLALSAAAEVVFPRSTSGGERSQWNALCYRFFTQPDAFQTSNFDSTYVGSRIASFLSQFGDASVIFEHECVTGIARVVAFILGEVTELANNYARDGFRDKITSADIRMVVQVDPELRHLLQFSRVYWEGRGR